MSCRGERVVSGGREIVHKELVESKVQSHDVNNGTFIEVEGPDEDDGSFIEFLD